MAKNDQFRFTRVYHTIVAIIILLAGGALLGLGIWLTATDNGGPFNLDYSGQSSVDFMLRTDVAAMVVGGFLLLTAIVSLVALSKALVGKSFRVIYVIMALVIFFVLVAITVLSIIVLRNINNFEVRSFVANAWVRTVENDPSVICGIEKTFKCRGFISNDCLACPTGLETECAAVSTFCAECGDIGAVDPSIGCFEEIISRFSNLFLPAAIVSGILSVIVLVDIFFTCCL